MSFIDKLIGTPVVGGIEAIGNIIDDLWTTDEEKLDKELIRQRINLKASEIQTRINEMEATHRSAFVAGWRPFIGWVGGISLAYSFLLHPFICWLSVFWFPDITPPNLVLDHLFELVTAMLGLGGLRTFEKIRGRSR